MNKQQKDILQTNTIQAVANNVGKEGKILRDNRNTSFIQKKSNLTLQRMEDDSIGARKRRLREEKERKSKMTSRQKAIEKKSILGKHKFGDSDNEIIEERPKKKHKKSNMWDGRTRPSFTDKTWETMLNSVLSKVRKDGVTVYQCSDNKYYPQKRDRKRKESYVTLDHKVNWKRYLYDNAKPDGEGEITRTAAQIAYNDTSNLRLMSNSDNSSKNGPKNQFD